jgi:hypothetical protein
MPMTLMQEFAEKHSKPGAGGVRYQQPIKGGAFLQIEHPVVLARFVSFVKGRSAGRGEAVYLRGQNADFGNMLASLYRGATSSADKNARYEAYKALLAELAMHLPHDRFRRDSPGALLQHYGVRTPWLDVVDNLYVAIWFARNRAVQTDGMLHFVRRNKGFGWICLVTDGAASSKPLQCVDLRREQSSLCTRPHVQHGLSLARQPEWETRNGSDFARYVVGRVRFELSPLWHSQGTLSSPEFMFPTGEFDSTAELLSPDLNMHIRTVEQQHRLAPGTLGDFVALKHAVATAV